MKLLSSYMKQKTSIIRKTALAFFSLLLLNQPIEASLNIKNNTVSQISNNELSFFPKNEIKDFDFILNTSQIVSIDLYDLELEKDNLVIFKPHPKIKYIRLIQLSKEPNVVRANIVFKDQQKITPKKIDNKIVLEVLEPKKVSDKKEKSVSKKSDKIAKELLFRDLNIKDSLQIISKMMNINLIIHDSVKDKKINFYVENLNMTELLDLLVETNGLIKKDYGKNTFIVCAKENYGEFGEKIYKTFRLNNAKPYEILSLIKNNKSLREKININNFSINTRLNSLSIYDVEDNISLIEEIIKSADEKLKQATIEIKLLEVNRKGLSNLGVSIDEDKANFAEIGHFPSDFALPMALKDLEQDSVAKIIASPKIRAIHGKKASIDIEKVIPVSCSSGVNNNSSMYGNYSSSNKEYKDVKVGIKLEVTPEITQDNEISMDLNATVDSILGINNDGQVSKSERNTNTCIRVKNGETVVLGGFIDENDYEPSKNNSLFNKIPILKGLSKKEKPEINRTEMIMLVTPRLVEVD